MAPEEIPGIDDPRTAAPESIPALLASADERVLRALIENPSLDETQICLLLERKDLPGTLLDEIAKRKSWRTNYRVRWALAGHPHTPRLVAMRLLRDLRLMDLVRISLSPASPVELRRLAEERVLLQLPQLPLGQRIMLARRGSARVAGGLIAQGPRQVAKHEKWSKLMNVRIALLRHPQLPVERVLSFLPDLPRRDVEDLLKLSRLPGSVRTHLRHELARRERK
jgi:hypothetical protein